MGGQPQNFRDEAGAFHESTFPNWSLGTRMKNALCDRAEYNPESAFSPAFSSDFMGLIHLTIWLKFLSELGIQVDNIEPNGPGSKPSSI